MVRLRAMLVATLPVVKVPFRKAGQVGMAPCVLVPNVPGILDGDLPDHLLPVCKLLEISDSRAASGVTLRPEALQQIKLALPSFVSPLVDYLIVKAGGLEFAAKLGVTKYRAANVVQRFDDMCDVTLPQIMHQAEGIVIARLAERSGKSGAEVRAASSSAISHQFRRLASAYLVDRSRATKESIATSCPELADVMREVIRANATDDVLYKKGETPVDEFLIKRGDRGSGGQIERFTRLINLAATARKMDVRLLGQGSTRALLAAVGAKQLGVLHNYDPPKVGKHFCSAEIVVHRAVDYLFSDRMRRLSIDQKANLKANSDHHANAGGNASRGMYQLVTERVLTHSHGAGGDHLAKYGLFSMLLYPVLSSACRPELAAFDLSEHVTGYDKSTHSLERPGLAVCLGHCQALEPENAYRDFADVCEMIDGNSTYFLTSGLKLVPTISIEKDNSHGVGDISCRFAFVVFCVLYDFDYGNIGSQEAGYSLLHGVESMQSAVGRRINGRPFQLPLLDPASATTEEMRAAMIEINRQICERADGATFNAGGNFVSASPAGSTSLASGFVWRPAELTRFLETARAGKANTFELEDMPSFFSYRELLLRSWKLLNATGVLACTKLTAHTFQFRKNALNPLCSPCRDVDSAFMDFLGLFGGWLPQPKPRPQTPEEKSARKFHYYDLTQRILPENRAPTAVDEFYPKLMMNALVANPEIKLLDKYTDGGNSLSEERIVKIENVLFVEKDIILYDLAERAAKVGHDRAYKALLDRHKTDGTATSVARIVEHVIGKPAGANAGWPFKQQLKEVLVKLKVKHDAKQGKRAVLMEKVYLHWRDLPPDRRPPPCAAATRATAAAAAVVPAAAAAGPVVAAAGPVVAAAGPVVAAAGAMAANGAGAARTREAAPGAQSATATAALEAAAEMGAREEATAAWAEAGTQGEGAATVAGAGARTAAVTVTAAGGDDEQSGERVDSAELDNISRLGKLAGGALAGSILDEEDEAAEELAEVQAEQAAITAMMDILAGEMHTCGRCREIFLEEKMHVKKSGPWANSWICSEVHGEECAARELRGGRGSRKRKAVKRPGDDGS